MSTDDIHGNSHLYLGHFQLNNVYNHCDVSTDCFVTCYSITIFALGKSLTFISCSLIDIYVVTDCRLVLEDSMNTIIVFAAAKGKGKFMVKEELKGPEVCKDPVRLTAYAVGVNVFKQGEDPMLKPPDQYPEW